MYCSRPKLLPRKVRVRGQPKYYGEEGSGDRTRLRQMPDAGFCNARGDGVVVCENQRHDEDERCGDDRNPGCRDGEHLADPTGLPSRCDSERHDDHGENCEQLRSGHPASPVEAEGTCRRPQDGRDEVGVDSFSCCVR